jgi:hypothetical protein
MASSHLLKQVRSSLPEHVNLDVQLRTASKIFGSSPGRKSGLKIWTPAAGGEERRGLLTGAGM